MENLLCQSCGMPLDEHTFGTNTDKSPNQEYCSYCYTNGAFAQNITMDEMIAHCIGFLDEFNKDSDTKFTREEAEANMKQFFPLLKRWRKK